ncbi:DUF1517 domain-containing protein [Spirulina sp.]|uniref:DUF1517 domain-containing protein n=1 Tax=Spirulina sp. TaxID=1157 RepID=UPI003F6FC5D5
MFKTIYQATRRMRFLKSIVVIGLIVLLSFGPASDALAARSGGRMGGGSFRMPSRSLPSRSAPMSPAGGGYAPRGMGGGFGFPFLIPFFGFGGGFGGLFTIVIGLALVNFIVNAFRNSGFGGEEGDRTPSKVSVAKVQVGLLGSAQGLKTELEQLAQNADTGTANGRANVLQATSLAILRHPELWVYGAAESQYTALEAAESTFNQLALTERSKFNAETLSNVDSALQQLELQVKTQHDALVEQGEVGEYLVATIIVGAVGKLDLPNVTDGDSLKTVVQQLGSVGGDRLLAVEILWTPQADGDTLSTDDILANYPNLTLI